MGAQCGSVAIFVKGTNAKFANLPQKSQSNHSPTAMLRIFLKGSSFSCHCEPRKDIRLECLSTKRGEAIKALSRKAKSTNKPTS
ncbi:hypothetical protein [Helicobacter canis]|uniref:hypothetical protein n=1 Tax=Helicobacter canis TaxID=29419 RepID=UPI002942B283|nr:hypothetical protein [Helicobacter canis]